ncbi:class I SAM-dependent methyltransferase [Mycolicibacterium sp. XJ1904]
MKVILKFSPIARRNRHGGVRRMLRALGRDVASATTWVTMDTDLRRQLSAIIDRTPRVHESQHYSPIIEGAALRARPIKMLEIRSFYGDSLQMWQEYLHSDSLIVGVDVDSNLLRVANAGDVRVRIGTKQNASILRELTAEFGPFDVIIDSGSQTSSRMVDTFSCLFPDSLNDGGIYIVEDVYCDYWTIYNSFSSTDIAKALLDVVRGHYAFGTDVTKFHTGHLLVARRAAGDRLA